MPDSSSPSFDAYSIESVGREKARILGNRALGALRNFAAAFKVSYAEFEVGVKPEPGLAASGDLETDLTDLLLAVGEAADAADRPTAILIDEVQYLHDEDLRALIVALHRCSQRALPLIMFGAGLPQLAAVSGEAKSYAERLFDFPEVGPLDENAIKDAIRVPIEEAGAEIEDDALSEIADRTQGYPYFLQEWGAHSWKAAPGSPVTMGIKVSGVGGWGLGGNRLGRRDPGRQDGSGKCHVPDAGTQI